MKEGLPIFRNGGLYKGEVALLRKDCQYRSAVAYKKERFPI